MIDTNETKTLLILIDGHALVHRSFHAIQQPLTISTTGEDVRAVYGFANAFLRSISELNPSHVAITFDLPAPTFRHKMFDEYKAHRPPTPPELRGQFDVVRKLMRAFEVPIYELEGFEADDLLGTLSAQSDKENIETIILTGDSDTLQLVTSNVKVLMSSSVQNRTIYDVNAVKERYGGLGPEYVAEIKALQGDSSDNIPGVPGIGIKTAISLLGSYGSLTGIYENIDNVKPPRAKTNLENNYDLAFRSKDLTTIVKDVPISLDLDKSKFGDYSRKNVIDLLGELEFHSIIPRIPQKDHLDSSDSADSGQLSFLSDIEEIVDYIVVDDEEKLNSMLSEIRKEYGFSFDTETTSINPMTSELVGISFSLSPNSAYYIPVGHDSHNKQLDLVTVLEQLKPIFEDPNIPIRAHNANFDITVMSKNGITVKGLQFDTMIAAHLSGKRTIGLKELALEYFGKEMTNIKELIGSGKSQITMAEVPVEKAAPYAAADADFTERLYKLLKAELESKNLISLYEEVEIPLVDILVTMQRHGVSLNTGLLSEMSNRLGDQLEGIRSQMYELIGHEFNLNSPKQMSDLLFEDLNLPKSRKTKSGFSTDAQALEDLKVALDTGRADESDPRAYEVLDRILEYREVSKIKSTYVDSLPTMINPETKRVHTSYRQTGTTTGRISSNDPNVQNIPVRTDLGRRVREAFITEDSSVWKLLAADYSQIELRVLAHYSQDDGLIAAFNNGEDIHSSTAALVHGVSLDEVTGDMRRVAKVLNFGVIYGLSPHGISRQTNLSQKAGKTFIDIYFDKYPGIQKYLDAVKEQCRETGYVETLLGRRRYLPDINSRNFRVRSQAERAAINMPIQGTAADIIKIAMLNISQKLIELNLSSKMILQVHDELIFESPKVEVDQLESLITEIMPNALKLDVPLTVETKSGSDWGNMS